MKLLKNLDPQDSIINEEWKTIRDFSKYKISNLGRIYNLETERMMRTSKTTFGHVKISLISEWDGRRYTRSVALLVAESFVEAPNILCDYVVILDGDLANVAAYNLVWRPAWYAWKYTRQLKIKQPVHFLNLPVVNLSTNIEYTSIVEAGMKEGILFQLIWESTFTGRQVFPYGHVYEVV